MDGHTLKTGASSLHPGELWEHTKKTENLNPCILSSQAAGQSGCKGALFSGGEGRGGFRSSSLFSESYKEGIFLDYKKRMLIKTQ